MLSITPSQLENGKKITTYDYRCASPQAFSRWGSAVGLVCRVESCSSALCPRGPLQRGWLMASAQRDTVRRGLPGRLYLRPGALLALGLRSSLCLVNRLSPPVTCGLRPPLWVG